MKVYGFPDIFFDIVDKMRPLGNVTNITEASNILTFTVPGVTDLLQDNQVIDFSGISGIEKEVIFDVTDTSFKCKKPISFVIGTFGTWKATAPFEFYSEPLEFTADISLENSKLEKNVKQYPAIYLVDDISETKINTQNWKIDRAEIYFIIRVNAEVSTIERYKKKYPYLHLLKETFYNELESRHNFGNDLEISSEPICSYQIGQNEIVMFIKTNFSGTYNNYEC